MISFLQTIYLSFFLDIPVIPDLEEQQDDDMTVKVAIAPK